MARRLYLHIGTMKAATTYLQKLFDLNADRLAGHGILWHSTRLNHQAVHEFQGSPMLQPDMKGSWPRLSREVRRTPGDVLMSMELLARLPRPLVEQFVDGLAAEELHVVVTARDLAHVVPSAWQETVQNREAEPWATWVRQVCLADPPDREGPTRFWQHHYLPGIVEKWSRVAPVPGGVHLVTVPQGRGDPVEVWRRFSSVLGVQPDGFEEPRYANESLGGTSAELMRRLNTLTTDLDFLHYHAGFKSAVAKRTLAQRAGTEPRPTVPPELYPRLYEISRGMTDRLADMGLDVAGDLADLVPPETAPAGGYDPGQSTDAELLGAATEGLVSLGRRVADLEVERRRLRRKNAELRRKLRNRSVAGRLDEARRVAVARLRSGEERLRASRLAETRLAGAARGARRRLRRRRPR